MHLVHIADGEMTLLTVKAIGCKWGTGFLRYDGNYIRWGNMYKDISGAYRRWGDDFVDGNGDWVHL